MLSLGIDEAGRGPVLGPMVLCGVWATDEQLEQLAQLDVRDSKAFGASCAARSKRSELAEQIKELASCVKTRLAAPDEIDRWVEQGGLNKLERKLARSLIEEGPETEQIIADGHRLFAPLRASFPSLEAINRADSTHLVVAAASIVAKDARDSALHALLAPYEEEFGPIGGGGYPNAATKAFLCAFFDRCKRLPDGVRRSWSWAVLRELDPSCGARDLLG